ncbi:MAG: hypothetical protein LBM71_02140 [Elusimicrobiota bacterium]|jgi:hypothetical protein|nr:hypothetical protein [Elusimicrobiota bacterium]
MKKALILAMYFVFLFVGCTWVGTVKNVNKFDQNNIIDTQASFYLLVPKDGHEIAYFTYKRTENKGSGREVVNTFFEKFHKEFGSLVISEENMSVSQGLGEAKARGDKYMIAFDIDEWNDEFYMTCKPYTNGGQMDVPKTDSLDVTINVYDVATGELINKQRFQNAGCPTILLGFIPIGATTPSGRFNSSLSDWVKNVQNTVTSK